MRYTGYSQTEIDKIISILDAHRVAYEVSADNSAIEKAHGVIKDTNYHVDKRHGTVENSFYSISIAEGALKAVLPSILKELERHNIFPEMEMLPEERKPVEKFVLDEKRGTQHAIGMGFSSFIVMIVAIIAWCFFIKS